MTRFIVSSAAGGGCELDYDGAGRACRGLFVIVRFAKIVCIVALALYMALVAFGNITDYSTNFVFVERVLGMADIGNDATIRWRAATAPLTHQFAYAAIIATEVAITVLILRCALAMLRALNAGTRDFQRAKSLAILGPCARLSFVRGRIIAIGGEWFGMWRAPGGGAEQAAFRIALTMLGLLIFVSLKDEDAT